jgi:gliding motility-associated-like protein
MRRLFKGGITVIVLIIVLFSSNVTAQDGLWYFGTKNGLDVSVDPPVLLAGPHMAFNAYEAIAVASDASGNVLFYTDGTKIFNKNHTFMLRGDSLWGSQETNTLTFYNYTPSDWTQGGLISNIGKTGSSPNGVMIAQVPNSTTKYYVFTINDGLNGTRNGFRYSVVDMALDGGDGAVVASSKNTVILDGTGVPTAEGMAVSGSPCSDSLWVVVHGRGNNNFYAVPFDQNGALPMVTTSIGKVVANAAGTGRGSLEFNSNSSQLASANMGGVGAQILDFDSKTGTLSNVDLCAGAMDAGVYALEFSPDNNQVYFSNQLSVLYHYNIATQVTTSQNIGSNGEIELAPNGKVYVARNGSSSLGVINNPNATSLGAAGYVANGVAVTADTQLGLPRFFKPDACAVCNSVGGTIAAGATVCSGANGATLTLSGHTGSIVRWESSTDNWTITTAIANVTTTQAYLNLTSTTKYRAVVQDGACATANSAEVTITVDPATVGGAVTLDATVCSGANGATLTLSGHTGSIVRWESSIDNWTTTTAIANVTTTQAYLNLTSTTKYRAVVKSGACANGNSAEATITVDPATVGGAVTLDATVCSGANGATLTLAGHTGSIVRWESSTDNWTTTTTIANVTTTQAYLNLAATTKYRAVVKSGGCANANSAEATITVTASVGGTVTADAVVCTGANGATLTLSGHTGSIVRWESSTDNWTTTTAIANVTTTQAYLNLVTTTKYRAVVQAGACATATSAEATITVGAGTTAGTVTADAVVCTGVNGAILTLAGHVGSILSWESSTDNWATTTAIANVTTTQAYLNLVTTTKYRAIVKSGTCAQATSIEATITVSTATGGGAVTLDATVCSGVNGATLSLAGHTGSIVRWESTTDNWTPTTAIANVTNTQAYLNLTSTTKYRAVVQSGGCATANSAEVTITVDPPTIGGTITADATVCDGVNGATLTLAGETGAVVSWESSTDNWTTTTAIANVTTTQAYLNLTSTTKYRAVVQSGSCATANSAEVTITVDPATVGGAVTLDATVCSGANGATLTLSGHTGSVVRWESSTDNWTTTTAIANITITQAYLNLTATTKYRAVVQSGSCATANSAEVTITVDPPTIGGTITADATVCDGVNGATLTLAGETGAVVRWESSTDNWTTTTAIANVTNTQAYLNLTSTTKYRAVVQSGVCATANSAEVTITVDPATVGGTITADATVCEGVNGATLTLAGETGAVVRWESSTDNWTNTTTITNVTNTQAYLNLTSTTKYRAVVQSGACATANSAEVTIIVDPATVGGAITADATVCDGVNGATLTLAGETGAVVRWESSTDNWTNTATIANVTNTQAYLNLTSTTKYRAVVQSGLCTVANSAEATITVSALPTGATAVDGDVCGTGTVNISVANVPAGSTIDWYAGSTGGALLTGGTGTSSFTTPSISVTTIYYAEIRNIALGCISAARVPVTATIKTTPAVSVNGPLSICIGDPAETFTATYGAGVSIINWNGDVLETGNTYSTSVAGEHTVYATNGTCTDSVQGTLIVNDLPLIDLGGPQRICDGTIAEIVAGTYASVNWSDGSTGSSVSVDTTATIMVEVTDGNGCKNSDAVDVTWFENPVIIALREDTTICEKAGDQVMLTVENTGVSVRWQDGNTAASYTAIYAGEYEAVITDANGCSDSDKVVLAGFCTPITLTMPNIFTPNGNGTNDYMRPLEMEWADKDFMVANILNIRFYVYDRWGIMVHATEGVLPKWDGHAANGLKCSDGTYFWDLKYTDAGEEKYHLNGFVKLYNPKAN